LLNEGAIGLLVFNAITVGGFLALLMLWVGQLAQRLLDARRERLRAEPPVSTQVAFGSIPPPAS
jgi:hypothetical protein